MEYFGVDYFYIFVKLEIVLFFKMLKVLLIKFLIILWVQDIQNYKNSNKKKLGY